MVSNKQTLFAGDAGVRCRPVSLEMPVWAGVDGAVAWSEAAARARSPLQPRSSCRLTIGKLIGSRGAEEVLLVIGGGGCCW